MTAPGGDIDGGTPASPDAASVPTLDEFRTFVGATEADDSRLDDDLEEAMSMVDLFCKDAHTPIPDKTRKKWYLIVGAELFDATQAPSASARFENDVPASRSSRDPMHSDHAAGPAIREPDVNLTQARDEIEDSLVQAGLLVQGWEVQRVNPPIVIIVPAEPHIDTDARFATHGKPFVSYWLIQLVAGRGTGDQVRRKLDDMIAAAVRALAEGMQISDVRAPLIGEKDDTIGAEIEASIAINLKEE